jgi:septal ring factor EnvC (AmiA/AmiB activator)
MEYLKKWTKTALIVLTFVASIAVTKHKFDYQQAQLDQTKLEMRQTRDLLDQISHNTDTLLQQMKRLEETHPYSGKR